jgi:hypothetical protein
VAAAQSGEFVLRFIARSGRRHAVKDSELVRRPDGHGDFLGSG